MGVKSAKWLGYGFDGGTVLLLGLSLYWTLLGVVGTLLTAVMFAAVFLLRILMRYPMLFAYPASWGVEGAIRQETAPYGVAWLKSICVLLAALPALQVLWLGRFIPLGTYGLMLLSFAWIGVWAVVILAPVRRRGREAMLRG